MGRLYVLFEHAGGYALFKCIKFDDESQFLVDLQKNSEKLDNFKSIMELVNFQPFRTGRDALENMNSVSEGILHSQLQEFLENNLPQKKKNVTLGISESKLASAIAESFSISCCTTGVIPDIVRGIRLHFHELVAGFSDLAAANKAQLGLGHHYSRARVKFNVNRIDNMIIQSIALLDQLDKDINTFTMRVREWYSHHFPELIKIVPENTLYLQCVRAIKDRKELPEDLEDRLDEIINDRVKAQRIIEVAKNSMGMDISAMDLENVYVFAERIIGLTQRRKDMMEYLRSKMHSVAPNLAALIGEVVGARLISHAGSLINLAKYPASTVQILGAEKALFRALKTRGNTPKYGLIFHSRFIGKASKANKGRISRYLANKCSVASRIDCFRDVPTDIFGLKLRQQVEDRLKFYETGELPAKNVDVMVEALEEAEVAEAAIKKQLKKAKKKAKKEKQQQDGDSTEASETDMTLNSTLGDSMDTTETDVSLSKKKKKKNKHRLEEMSNNISMTSQEDLDESQPPKKKRKSAGNELIEEVANGIDDVSSEKKKKKKRKSES